MTNEEYSVNLGVASWEIDFFGRIRSMKRQALETYLATDAARRSARTALIAEVARAYWRSPRTGKTTILAHSTVDTQQAAYELVKKRFDAGLATELDLRRARFRSRPRG